MAKGRQVIVSDDSLSSELHTDGETLRANGRASSLLLTAVI